LRYIYPNNEEKYEKIHRRNKREFGSKRYSQDMALGRMLEQDENDLNE